MIRIFPDSEAVARAAAETVVESAARSIAARGLFRIGLSGGTTPRRLYELLAEAPYRTRVEWEKVEVLSADERGVPPDHPASNYGMVREALLARVGLREERIHRMGGEAEDLDQAAREYEPLLREPIDLLILGIGEDGHTASLFPGTHALQERERRVVATVGPTAPQRRITITARVIQDARQVLVLATGESKARAVALALEGAAGAVPASLARDRDWFLDRAAAARLRITERVGGAGNGTRPAPDTRDGE